MSVTLRHENGIVTEVHSSQQRAPWTTCPGAIAQLEKSFKGFPLARIPGGAQKRINCTHLYDLALLGAAHALDAEPFIYDVLVSDPINAERQIELRRNGAPVLQWTEKDGVMSAPAELVGLSVYTMSAWVASQRAEHREYARLLSWAARVALGRFFQQDEVLDPTTLPLSCFTFQPGVVEHAGRAMQARDFSAGDASPLDGRFVGGKISAK